MANDPGLLSVAGRVIVVTGAGRGIGAAVAAGLARAGASVHGLDVQYESTGSPFHATTCDVTDEGALRTTLDGIVHNTAVSMGWSTAPESACRLTTATAANSSFARWRSTRWRRSGSAGWQRRP